MKRIVSIVLVLLLGAGTASAGISNHPVISEVYVNAVDETKSEWIEIYNPTNVAVDISGWRIATPSSTATIPADTFIPPYGYFLIGDLNWHPDNASWPSPDHKENITLGNANSWVRLNSSTGIVVDTVGWGNAVVNETRSFSPNPPEGKSIERKTNESGLIPGYGNAWDTDNNSADFVLQDVPNPQNAVAPPVPPIPELATIVLVGSGMAGLVGLSKLRRKGDN